MNQPSHHSVEEHLHAEQSHHLPCKSGKVKLEWQVAAKE